MKYMGSKSRICKDILPIILRDRVDGQCYFEPFAGGMNSICNVGGFRIANDSNHYLIEMWKSLINGWIPSKVTKDEYLAIRNNKDSYPNHVVGWVGFNCSYSGKWFGGFAGETKTKGGLRDYQEEARNNVLSQISKLKGVKFISEDYQSVIIPDKSIIYCDPPYAETTKYSSSFNHDLFWSWARQTSLKHTLFISEYSAPSDFSCVWSKEVKSSLSANGISGGSKSSIEKLFVFNR